MQTVLEQARWWEELPVTSSARFSTMKTFGRNLVGPEIRRLRCQAGLSQPALAGRCQLMGWDIGRDTIAKIEACNRWVGDFELVFLARALECRLLDLFPVKVQKELQRKQG